MDDKSYPARRAWTAFTTPFLASLLTSVLLLISGCSEPAGKHGITINQVDARGSGFSLTLNIHQEMVFSRAANRAIKNGVTLTFLATLEFRNAANLALLKTVQNSYDVRYLPMSKRYQLVDNATGMTSTYPRLRHVLRALSNLRITLKNSQLPAGEYELKTRVRLDRSRLPGPVQIPALLFNQWHHDSGWTQWQITIAD